MAFYKHNLFRLMIFIAISDHNLTMGTPLKIFFLPFNTVLDILKIIFASWEWQGGMYLYWFYPAQGHGIDYLLTASGFFLYKTILKPKSEL